MRLHFVAHHIPCSTHTSNTFPEPPFLILIPISSAQKTQYCQLLEKGNRELAAARCTKCPPNCADTCTIHPVQQGEVSSTEPLPPASADSDSNDPNAAADTDAKGKSSPEISAYFEAVEHYISSSGWALLKIRADGHIDTVTENIEDLIRFKRADLQQTTIYKYLHPSDHAKLSPLLSTMSLSVSAGWDSLSHSSARQPNALVEEDSAGSAHVVATKRAIKTRLRMLCKYPLDAPRQHHHQSNGGGAAEPPFDLQKLQRSPERTYTEVVFFATPFSKGEWFIFVY